MSGTLTPVLPDPLSKVGQALMAQLAALFPPASFELRVVPAPLTAKVWTELTRRMPFVGLGWNGFEATGPTPTGGVQGMARYSVFLAVRNAKGPMERYYGDALGLGLFAMVSVAAAGLNQWKMPGVGSVIVTKVDHSSFDGADENMALAVLDIEVKGVALDVAGSVTGFTLSEFQKLAASYVENGETLVADNYPVGNWT